MRRQTTWVLPGRQTKSWRIVDAEGQPLGRLAAEVAVALMGKNRPDYTPFTDTGDHVIVVNGTKVELTGKKAEQKMKLRYTEYPGGLKAESYGSVRARKPEQLIGDAVKRMLPKNRLGRVMLSNLHVFPGAEHPYADRQPVKLDV